ncbi:MAG: WG repeat-containing protein [Bacteroidales bacterium]|nr:WG repeat-containing protein [Bacteroidales bacterium]
MNRDVFISYSRKNLTQVTEVKNQIDRSCDTECWIDLKGIESGSEMFLRDIVGGIDACKVFLFMLSRESMESEYALLELNYAKENGKRVVLVNIDDCRMNGIFQFKYSLTDTIAWNNPHQREKLLRDVKRWVGSSLQQELPQIERKTSPKDVLLDIRRDGKWGFANANGDIVIPCKWDNVWYFREGLAKVVEGIGSKARYSYIDRKGNEVIPLNTPFHPGDFHEGLAYVSKWFDYGFIDKNGKLVIPIIWKEAYDKNQFDFKEGMAAVMDKNNRWVYIDKNGDVKIEWKISSDRSCIAYNFSEGLAQVKDSKGWGFIDKNGRLVIPCQWESAGGFSDGLASVRDNNDNYGYIDKSGRLVIPCIWKKGWASFNEGLAYVGDNNGKYGFIDKSGRIIIPCQYGRAKDFSEGLAAVYDTEKKGYGYIDKNGRIVIPCQWKEAYDFGACGEGYARVVDSRGKYAYIDRTGSVVLWSTL